MEHTAVKIDIDDLSEATYNELAELFEAECARKGFDYHHGLVSWTLQANILK